MNLAQWLFLSLISVSLTLISVESAGKKKGRRCRSLKKMSMDESEAVIEPKPFQLSVFTIGDDCFHEVFSFLDAPLIMNFYQVSKDFNRLTRNTFPLWAYLGRLTLLSKQYHKTFYDELKWISKYSERETSENFCVAILFACKAGLSLPCFLPYMQVAADTQLDIGSTAFEMSTYQPTVTKYLFEHDDFERFIQLANPKEMAEALFVSASESKLRSFLPLIIQKLNLFALRERFDELPNFPESRLSYVVSLAFHFNHEYLDNYLNSGLASASVYEVFIRAILHSFQPELAPQDRVVMMDCNNDLISHIPSTMSQARRHLDILNAYLFSAGSTVISEVHNAVSDIPLLVLALASVVKKDTGLFSFLTDSIGEVPVLLRPLFEFLFQLIRNQPEFLACLNFGSTSQIFLRLVIQEAESFLQSSPKLEESIAIVNWIRNNHQQIISAFPEFSFVRLYFTGNLSELLSIQEQMAQSTPINWLIYSIPDLSELKLALEQVIRKFPLRVSSSSYIELNVSPCWLSQLFESKIIRKAFTKDKLLLYWDDADYLQIIQNDALYEKFSGHLSFSKDEYRGRIHSLMVLVHTESEIQRLIGIVGENTIFKIINEHFSISDSNDALINSLFKHYKSFIIYYLQKYPEKLFRRLRGDLLIKVCNEFPSKAEQIFIAFIRDRVENFVKIVKKMHSAKGLLTINPIQIKLEPSEKRQQKKVHAALEKIDIDMPITVILKEAKILAIK